MYRVYNLLRIILRSAERSKSQANRKKKSKNVNVSIERMITDLIPIRWSVQSFAVGDEREERNKIIIEISIDQRKKD